MPKKKDTGYSSLTLARRLILEKGEAQRMGRDGRLDPGSAESVVDGLDDVIEVLFCSWLLFQSKKRGYPLDRAKWNRTKWEQKLVAGQAREPYRTRYLERAGLA